MLRPWQDSSRRLAAYGFQAAGMGGLLLALVLLSPLAGRGQETIKAEKATPVSDRPAFDLTYVPVDAMGVLAVRPNVIFSDPAMRPLARMANEALRGLLPSNLPADLKLPIEEIEQVIGFITIVPNKGEPKGVHNAGYGLTMIRAAHDYDWLNLMKQLDPKMEEVHWKGLVYYKCRPPWLSGLSSKGHVGCFIPDKRTLVLPGPGALREGQAGETNRRPPRFSWDKDWKRVEHDLIAVAQDNRWTRGLSAEQIGGEPWANPLAQHTATMVAGVDWKDGIDFHAYLACKDPASAKQAMRDLKAMIKGMGQTREARFQVDPDSKQLKPVSVTDPHEIDPTAMPPEIALLAQFQKDLVKHAHVTRQEATVRVHTAVKLNIAEVVKILTPLASPTQP